MRALVQPTSHRPITSPTMKRRAAPPWTRVHGRRSRLTVRPRDQRRVRADLLQGSRPDRATYHLHRAPDSTSTWRTIVGVVGSEHQVSPATPPAYEAIAPFTQEGSRSCRSSRGRRVTHALAPGDPSRGRRDGSAVGNREHPPHDRGSGHLDVADRFLMTLLSMFGVIGLVLAIVGVYGVVAQLVKSRMREMGIRIALGARGRSVQWLTRSTRSRHHDNWRCTRRGGRPAGHTSAGAPAVRRLRHGPADAHAGQRTALRRIPTRIVAASVAIGTGGSGDNPAR